MRFLTKYELLEPITGGALESFIARDIASNEQVLVHIFAGLEALGNLAPIQWALQSYRGIAPPLPGGLIEGGRYKQTSQAYLVSKCPSDQAALQKWIRLYRLHAGATQDSSPPIGDSAPLPQTGLRQDAHVQDRRPEEIPGDMGELTRAFLAATPAQNDAQGGAAPSESIAQKPLPSEVRGWSRHPTGAFTKEFLPAFDEVPAAAAPIPPKISETQPEPSQAQSFTSEFALGRENSTSHIGILGGGFAQNTAASFPPAASRADEPDSPANKEAGEFTEFFRGPFDGRHSASAPAPTPEPVDLPSRSEQKGEFTKMFGSGKADISRRDDAAMPLVEHPGQSEPGMFTQLFESERATPPRTKVEARPLYSLEPDESQDREPEARWGVSDPDLRVPARKHVSPYPPEVSTPKSAAIPSVENTLAGEGFKNANATQVFTPRGGRSVPEPPPIAAGPSDYTRVVSRQPPPPELSQPNPVPSAPPGPAPMQVPPGFMPQAPVMPQPRMPAMPSAQPGQFAPQVQYPQMQYPPMPQPPAYAPPNMMMPPQMPAAPQAMPSSPPRVSYWPLIIALNVLFIAAVALVLYFALRN